MVTTGLNTDAMKQYTTLVLEKRELEGRIKVINQQTEALEKILVEQFQLNGVQNLQIAGATLCLHPQLWARVADGKQAEASAALESLGLGEMVKPSINAQTLSAWVRERRDNKEAIPPQLLDVLKISETVKMGVRKAE